MRKISLFLLMIGCSILQAQSIVSWTESNGTLGLGYPVPIPVETTEPFDGFRTYNGLFTKHQSIALNNDYITGHIVGQTHYDRDIWAYVLSDENILTKYGVKEGAMLINGGIHAREWQSPEVQTGIIELLGVNANDQSLHQYLLENTTIVTVPINNVDGFLQTQRFPDRNTSDIRDGRMRRKNMHGVDEDINTFDDYLLGVDLNRNNSPYWATSNRSSPDVISIVYHGRTSESEPETQARLTAADLVDADQVRIYTDVHSFSKVHFSVRTNNSNRTTLQRNLLRDFSNHHRAFSAAKNYVDRPSGPGGGIGSTDEYFALAYEVPSWTLEVEPGGNGGVEYGGSGVTHSGFILPESEIKRVREELAQTFMITWYGQAGPPSIAQFRIIEKASQNVVYDASWDIQSDGTRLLFEHKVENMFAGLEYSLIVTFDKPMRARDINDQIAHLQGQSGFDLNPEISADIDGITININSVNRQWMNEKSQSTLSYKYYKDDTFTMDFSVPSDVSITENSSIAWSIDVSDMVGQKLDANPQTVTTWADGQWQNYEDSSLESSIFGGVDNSYSVAIRDTTKHAFPPLIQPTGLYFDPDRSGEGFSYELLDGNRVWIQWFTFDNQGTQRWYSAIGLFSGNKIVVNNFTQASGGVFGIEFDTDNVAFSPFGSLEIIFDGGETRDPIIGFHNVVREAKVVFADLEGKKLRTNLQQLSVVKGALNRPVSILIAIEEPVGLITGSWYDPGRSGEGYIVEILEDGRAVLIWYTYDLEGNHMWLIDSSGVVTENGNEITLDFNNLMIADGGIFGETFNPDDVNLSLWGEVKMQLNCLGSGTVEYNSSVQGFGSGQYNVTKLTNPWVLSYVCDAE